MVGGGGGGGAVLQATGTSPNGPNYLNYLTPGLGREGLR